MCHFATSTTPAELLSADAALAAALAAEDAQAQADHELQLARDAFLAHSLARPGEGVQWGVQGSLCEDTYTARREYLRATQEINGDWEAVARVGFSVAAQVVARVAADAEMRQAIALSLE